MVPALLSIAIAYLLGSVSSSCIVGRLAGNLDIRNEPDGHISPAIICYRIGLLPFLIVVVMDISLAALGVVVAKELTNSINVMMISGLAAMAGHNWSIFLKFKGGVGATAIAGTLLVVMFWPLLYGLIAAGVVLLLTQKPGLSTALGIIAVSSTVFMRNGFEFLAGYPLALFVLMLLKEFQIGRLTETECREKPLFEEENPL